jgi:hypothetical protein
MILQLVILINLNSQLFNSDLIRKHREGYNQ